MRHFFFVFFFVLTLPIFCVSVHDADIDLTIIPEEGSIKVSAHLLVKPVPGTRTIELILNRSLSVTRVHASVPIKGFQHEKSGPGPYRYAYQATALTVSLADPASGETVALCIDVAGKVEPDKWGVIQVWPQWVELEAVYSGWFPFSPAEGRFNLTLKVHVPAGWTVAGTGQPVLEKGTWTAAGKNVKDVVVLASPALKKISVGKSLALWHVNLPEKVPDLIISDTQKVRKILYNWFGPDAGGHVDLVFPLRKSGGGFARPGLVLMLYKSGFYKDNRITPVFLRYLGHEVSHLWWQQAPVTSWQDWLNESFAEYTALMLLRKQFGETVFQKRISDYRRSCANTPPVRGISRNHKKAYTVLYRKGPVILADLEAKIGQKAFLRFVRALVKQKVNSTRKCLEVLEGKVSLSARKQLESSLATY